MPAAWGLAVSCDRATLSVPAKRTANREKSPPPSMTESEAGSAVAAAAPACAPPGSLDAMRASCELAIASKRQGNALEFHGVVQRISSCGDPVSSPSPPASRLPAPLITTAAEASSHNARLSPGDAAAVAGCADALRVGDQG